jgi:tRNA nucleotidyltransferase (CCA-adding enzyme)
MYRFIAENTIKNKCPSLFLSKIKKNGELNHILELSSLIGVPQPPDHHPEGCVFTHTLRVIDSAAMLKKNIQNDDEKAVLMLAALCHDFGKPYATTFKNCKFTAPKHDIYGLTPAINFLKKSGFEKFSPQILNLIKEHSKPLQLYRDREKVSHKAIIRLSERVDIILLLLLQSADSAGKNNNFPNEFSDATKWMMEKLNIKSLSK